MFLYKKTTTFQSDRNLLANKLVPNQHSDPGTFCLHYYYFFIFLTGRFHNIKFSGHFLVAFLDASNVGHFSCRFSRHLKYKMVHSASSQYSGQFHTRKMALNDEETLAEL